MDSQTAKHEDLLSSPAYSEALPKHAGLRVMSSWQAAEEIVDVADDGIVELAVFDFDGTCINGNSPVMLVRRLVRKRQLKLSVVLRIFFWAAAYKLRLPQNEAWVRGLVFRAFKGHPKEEVDAFLADFYDEVVAPRFRPGIDEIMKIHQQKGRVVMVVSASFAPIIERADEVHHVDYQISTTMQVDAQGNYMDKVSCVPVEGLEKPRAIKRFADATFGPGKWRLMYAYGDHHSDRPMLNAAVYAYPVTPDRPLTRYAKRRGWCVIEVSRNDSSELQLDEEVDISPLPVFK